MHHQDNDNWVGLSCGIVGGVTKFLIDIPHDTFMLQFSEALAIAFCSGIAGVLGKHLITKILKKK